MNAFQYAKRFSQSCNLGLQANAGLCELFLRCASDDDLAIHFSVAFPKFAQGNIDQVQKDELCVKAAAMYARVFSKMLPIDKLRYMAGTTKASDDVIATYRSLGENELASFLELATD